MGHKKNVKRVKRVTRKLEKAVRKATVSGFQRDFQKTADAFANGSAKVPSPSFGSMPNTSEDGEK